MGLPHERSWLGDLPPPRHRPLAHTAGCGGAVGGWKNFAGTHISKHCGRIPVRRELSNPVPDLSGPPQTGSGHPIRLGKSGRMAGNPQWRLATYSSAFSPSFPGETLATVRVALVVTARGGPGLETRIEHREIAVCSILYSPTYCLTTPGFLAPCGSDAPLAGDLTMGPVALIVIATGVLSCAVASERTSTICVPGRTVVGTCA